MAKKKVTNIFNLYKHETIAEFSDPYDNAAKIKIRKLTSDQARQASEYLDLRLSIEKARIEAEQKDHIEKTFHGLSKERLMNLIINIEAPYIRDIADLAPTEDNAKEKWEKIRREALDKESDESLVSYLIDLTIESKAKMSAYTDYNRMVLCLSCIDPDSGEQIFSIDSGEANYIGNCSQETLNLLTSKRQEIIAAETQGDLRRAAKDPNFT